MESSVIIFAAEQLQLALEKTKDPDFIDFLLSKEPGIGSSLVNFYREESMRLRMTLDPSESFTEIRGEV